MNRENLEKLADYLEKHEFPTRFDMLTYARSGCDDICFHELSKHKPCMACALGQAALSGLFDTDVGTWISFALKNFDISMSEHTWLFGGSWSSTDNTPEGCAKRIRILLDKGLPENWEEQMHGDDPLSY